jgi:hypothetical protein
MLAVERWEIWYGDGSSCATLKTDDYPAGCDPTCVEHTKHVATWAEAPPLGVYGIVYYHVGNRKTVQMEQHDQSIYRYLPDVDGAVEVEGFEVAGGAVKFGLWVANDQYLKVWDLARGEVTP